MRRCAIFLSWDRMSIDISRISVEEKPYILVEIPSSRVFWGVWDQEKRQNGDWQTNNSVENKEPAAPMLWLDIRQSYKAVSRNELISHHCHPL
jgi:hypothetical protein